MKYLLSIRKEAEADIQQAYAYYESCRLGLGQEFLLCIEAAIAGIERNPVFCPLVHKDVRRYVIHRFPYGIYYLVHDHRIIVIAVLHARRNPANWQSRS